MRDGSSRPFSGGNRASILMQTSNMEQLLGEQAESLLRHTCKTISKEQLHLPGPDFVDRVLAQTNRSPQVLRSMQDLYGHGRLAGTGYMSILPVDQGIEHSAGASFAPNPAYFDPENIIKLALEGGCNAVASTFGVLAANSRKYAHKLPFIVKVNHNEFLTYPNKFDQIMFGTVRDAWNLGATAVGATIYFGSNESARQIQEVATAFEMAHDLGMATILWCYLRNSGFKKEGVDYHLSADLTGQANHLGVTIQADIIKQKLPVNNGGYTALAFGKTHARCIANSRATTRSTSADTKSRIATWAASGSSTAEAKARAPVTWPKRSPPPSSTNGQAAPASSQAEKRFKSR